MSAVEIPEFKNCGVHRGTFDGVRMEDPADCEVGREVNFRQSQEVNFRQSQELIYQSSRGNSGGVHEKEGCIEAHGVQRDSDTRRTTASFSCEPSDSVGTSGGISFAMDAPEYFVLPRSPDPPSDLPPLSPPPSQRESYGPSTTTASTRLGSLYESEKSTVIQGKDGNSRYKKIKINAEKASELLA